jgi:hypothetical protein
MADVDHRAPQRESIVFSDIDSRGVEVACALRCKFTLREFNPTIGQREILMACEQHRRHLGQGGNDNHLRSNP